MKFTFIPLDYQYFDFNGKNYVKVYGRTKDGKRACIIDSYDSYFWAILNDDVKEARIKKLMSTIKSLEINSDLRKTKVLNVELHNRNFLGKEVKALKIFISNFKDAHALADKLDFPEIHKRREYDLSFISKYIMEKRLIPCKWVVVDGELLHNSNDFGGVDKSLNVDFVIKASKVSPLSDKESNNDFIPKVLGYDIEVDDFDVGRGQILMVSLVSDDFEKVITWRGKNLQGKKERIPDYVELVDDEKELLEKFDFYVKQVSPDILAGYYSDRFDLPYIRARAQKNKVSLTLGLDNSGIKFSGGKNRLSRIEGLIHLDIHRFIEVNYSQYLQSETLSLNEVSSELLGEKKTDFHIPHPSKLKETDWIEFFKYNLQDSVLAFKLAMKIWPDLSEFSKIMNKPLFEVSRDSMSVHVEDYILHNLYRFNEIADKRPLHDDISSRISREAYEGAFVFQPSPGLYENLAIFDFTSMYGSVIVTYNLSKSTFVNAEDESNKKELKNKRGILEVNLEGKKVYFNKKPGFFPLMLKEIIDFRKRYKKEYKDNPSAINKARSNAYKLIANAAYGYQGFFGARYYQREAAAATAALGRKSIFDAIDKIKNEGYEVIYSDTDSIAFLQGKKSKTQIKELLKKINSELPGIMELDLEDFYKRGLWVTTRDGKIGAKKKYALITEEGKLKVRGFETVRRDWCMLARNLQNEVLKRVLSLGNEKSALDYTKKIINDLKSMKVNKQDIIIKTQLKKPISEYKAVGPHVVAAKKMLKAEIPVDSGSLIEYFISSDNNTMNIKRGNKGKVKKGNIRDKVALPDEDKPYDVGYYLNNQVLPAVENIFQVFKVDIKDIILGEKQKKLF